MISVVYGFCKGFILSQGKQCRSQGNAREYDFPVLSYALHNHEDYDNFLKLVTIQGAFHALRPKDLWHGVSFLVSMAAWI